MRVAYCRGGMRGGSSDGAVGKKSMKDLAIGVSILMFALALFFYSAIAWPVFEWRNPKANRMAYYRHPVEVMSFEKMPEFQ